MHRHVPRSGTSRAHLGFPFIVVLTGIDGGVLEHLEEGEEAACEETSQQRTDPVDPVIPGETAVDDVRTERSRRVE